MDKPLSVNDVVFVNAYFSSNRSAVQAYRASHPKASYRTARVEAYRVLAKPSVKAEIAQRLQGEGGITKEFVQSHLLNALFLANNAKDAAVIASIAMDCAKLAGLITDKREVKTITDEEKQSVRQLVLQSLTPTRGGRVGEGLTLDVMSPSSPPTPSGLSVPAVDTATTAN